MSELPALYKIRQDLHSCLDMDIPEDQLADTLALLTDEFQEKAIQIGFVLETLNEQLIAINAHKEKVDARQAAFKKRIDRLKEYLKANMEDSGITKISGLLFTISIQNNPPSAVIDDELQLPPKYMEEEVKIKVNKSQIRQDLLSGVEIPGAHLEKGTHLRIR